MAELLVDTRELAQFAKVCKAVVPGLEKDFQKSLTAAGEIVARAARQNAAFSSRIPASVKTRRRGTRIRVQAGGDKAPHAAPLEHGGVPGSFRHPVYGNFDNWVSQSAHPFLAPAAEDHIEEMVAAVLVAVDVTVARLVS